MENDAVIDGNHGRKIQFETGAAVVGQIRIEFATGFSLFKYQVDKHIVLGQNLAVGLFVFEKP